MSMFKGMLAAVSVLSLAGCSTVYSTKPIGENVVSIVEPAEWEGTWINSSMDVPVIIKVTDAQKGILKAMWIEDMKLESHEVQLLGSGEWMFGNIKDDKDGRFLWGRIKQEASQIILWFPDVAKISALVKAGSLPGTVDEGGDVTLGDLKAEHLSLIMSDDKGILFDWTDPLVLIRLSK